MGLQLEWSMGGKINTSIDSPSRSAYIDESGNFGFDFDKEGVSKFFIICAVVVDNNEKDEIEAQVQNICNSFFPAGEMKSSQIKDNVKRRIRVLSELLQVNFRIIALAVDKQKIYDNSPIANYKKSFLKFLHNQLHQVLYSAYPKLEICFDETGYPEFQESFIRYVEQNRPNYNLYDEYDFKFKDSKESILIQVADIIAGTLRRAFEYPQEANYIGILSGKILNLSMYPETFEDYLLKAENMSKGHFDKEIYEIAYNAAQRFISNYDGSEEEQIRLQLEFLKYLLFQCRHINPTRFVSSWEVLDVLKEVKMQRIRPSYFYRKIVAPLRDAGVIISSSTQGYKIPVCMADIETYVNQTSAVVSPMLHRLDVCRRVIKQQTNGKTDILDKRPFLRYKKYFD